MDSNRSVNSLKLYVKMYMCVCVFPNKGPQISVESKKCLFFSKIALKEG